MTNKRHLLDVIKENDTIQEGSASITYNRDVFYNPVQEFNRDLSVLVISTYIQSQKKDKMSLIECLAASGLRSIRYALEIPSLTKIVTNDIDPAAIARIRANLDLNHIEEGKVIHVENGSANAVMQKYCSQNHFFDIIDLDPYGSAAPFIETAIQAISDGGLLCVTCTDMAVLAGSYPETCYSKYGSVPLKGDVCHESALRIVLSFIDRTAAKYKKYVTPILSCQVDFYLRVFVKISEKAAIAKLCSTRQAYVKRCHNCQSFSLQNVLSQVTTRFVAPELSDLSCDICSGRLHIHGPMWNQTTNDASFIHSALSLLQESKLKLGTESRIVGLLNMLLEELDSPLYYSLPECASILHAITPPMQLVKSAILNMGFKVSIAHCYPQSIKSDAPKEVLWMVLVKSAMQSQKGVASKKQLDDKFASHIINKFSSSEIKIDFATHPDSIPFSNKTHLLRFQENPTRCWGPLGRANSNFK